MDWKTYWKDTYKKASKFDRVFKPWIKWQNVKLSDACPCDTCEVNKELKARQYEVQIVGGLQEEITKPCKECMESLVWKMECLEKLAWYEDNDERLNSKND